MGNEQKKFDNHSRIYIIIIALVLCTVAYCSVRGCGSDADIDQLYKSTDSTVERIETTATGAAGNIADAAGRNNVAQKTIDRAVTELENSQRAAAESAERIDRIQSLVNECIRRNQESINLMLQIEGAVGERKK